MASTLLTDILGAWKFDGDATDELGNADGAVTGATNGSAYGYINEGYRFDGNDYIYLGANKFTTITNKFSMSFWINPQAVGTTYLWDLGFSSSGVASRNTGIRVYHNTGIFFSRSRGVGSETISLSATGVFTTNNWYHVVVTRSSNIMKIFVDGKLVAYTSSASLSDVLWSGGDYSSGRCNFGGNYANNIPGYQLYYNGYLDEPCIWDKQLSDGGTTSIGATATEEVAELRNSGAGNQYPFVETPVITRTFNPLMLTN